MVVSWSACIVFWEVAMKLRKRICRWISQKLCAELIWNRDMSLEIDRLVDENDRLHDRIRELERQT